MAFAVEKEVSFCPLEIRLFGTQAVMLPPDEVAQRVKKLGNVRVLGHDRVLDKGDIRIMRLAHHPRLPDMSGNLLRGQESANTR